MSDRVLGIAALYVTARKVWKIGAPPIAGARDQNNSVVPHNTHHDRLKLETLCNDVDLLQAKMPATRQLGDSVSPSCGPAYQPADFTR